MENNIKVSILKGSELFEYIFDRNTCKYKDKTVFERIRFFSERDFSSFFENEDTFYVVLFKGNFIIGIAKLSYYSTSAPNENTLSIAFF